MTVTAIGALRALEGQLMDEAHLPFAPQLATAQYSIGWEATLRSCWPSRSSGTLPIRQSRMLVLPGVQHFMIRTL